MKYFITIITAALISANVAYAFEPWTNTERNKFSQNLYNAAVEDNKWASHLDLLGVKVMTDCIADYYAERMSYIEVMSYWDKMPQHINIEFNKVLYGCFQVAKSSNNNFI